MRHASKKISVNPSGWIKIVSQTIAVISALVLLSAFLQAGIYYIFDNDELSHVQLGYLINSGFVPYRDFFSIYPPLFGWLLSLILEITGMTTAALGSIRVAMAGLFIVRLILIYILAQKIFHPAIGIMTVILFLLDPFNSFTAIQIRPDNLMLTFFLGSIVASIGLAGKKKVLALFFHAILLILSILTLPKIIPGAAILFLTVLLYLNFRKLNRLIPTYIAALLTGVLVVMIPFAATGALPQLTQNTIFDPPKTNEALLYPTRLGTFYLNDINYGFYGHAGKPATWYLVWLLPVMAFAGLGVALNRFFEKKNRNFPDLLVPALSATLIGQFTALLFIRSVFIQYYIPITWLYALFSAYLVWYLGSQLTNHRFALASYGLIATLVFFPVARDAYRGNINRSLIKDGALANINKILETTALDQKTFPNALFRPFSYPFPYGYFYGDIPREIRDRYKPLRYYIERDQLPYLYAGKFLFDHFDYEDQEYIKQNYIFRDDLWVRKTK